MKRYLPPGRYRCPKCKREVVLLVASRALCMTCHRAMRLVKEEGYSYPQHDLEAPPGPS